MSNKGSDKRSVSTDALDTLGTAPLDENQKRDAIHLAVEPVIAGESLRPGDHIRITDGVAFLTDPGTGLGIVDPFLMRRIVKGERFWFVMYPRMVHSLRHVWAHPAFPDEPTVAAETKPVHAAIEVIKSKAFSEQWLRDFCANADCPDYETVMELIDKGSIKNPDDRYYESGGYLDERYLHFTGSDAHGEIPAEFWMHAEVVLGRTLENRPAHFSCSC